MPNTNPPEVFISYSSKDKKYKDELVKQLKILAQQQVISTWHDGLLVPGQQWNKEIVEHLNSSRVILLLISPDFLTSDYVNRVELKTAAERHRRKEVCVIPVLIRNVNAWKSVPFGELKLGDLQAVPAGEKFVADWDNRDKAFAEIANGIQKAVHDLSTSSSSVVQVSEIPRSPIVGFVARSDRNGRNLIELLQEELAPQKAQLVALWGAGGVGKTTLAAETARALSDDFSQRVVWVSADSRPDLPFTTFLDEIATQLGEEDLRKLAPEPKSDAVRILVEGGPTLIVLDNFETISELERAQCLEFLQRAHCSGLITTRQRLEHVRSIPITGMSTEEATDFLQLLIEQTQDPSIFAAPYRERVMETAEFNPLIMEWIVGQIALANDPEEVLNELTHGEGDAAHRVFDRSYNLPQLNDGGRALLLALSLFTPSGGRPMVASVANMDLRKTGDKRRFKKAQETLASLWLIKTVDGGQRLAVAGLTRELTRAHLYSDLRGKTIPQRFVSRFFYYANAHSQPTRGDYNALESEKDNLLCAFDVAFDIKDWNRMFELARIVANAMDGMLSVRGYWDDALRVVNRASGIARSKQLTERIEALSHDLAMQYHKRGEIDEARRLYYESLGISESLQNQSGIAASLHQLAVLSRELGDVIESRRLCNESLEIKKKLGYLPLIASSSHLLAILAQDQGELDQARQLYNESLEISRKLNDEAGIAISLHQLATLAQDEDKPEEAGRLYSESLEIARKLGNQSGISKTVHQLAILAHDQGKLDEARLLYQESLGIAKRLGDQSGIADTLHQLATLAQDQGELDEARRLYNESLEIAKKLSDQSGIAITLHQLGTLAELEDNNTEAGDLGETEVIQRRDGTTKFGQGARCTKER